MNFTVTLPSGVTYARATRLRQRLVGSAKHGRLHVDKLVRVRLLTGQRLLALIHAEIQGRGESEAKLPARMFHYHIRLREKHPQQSLVSLAVLTHRSDGSTTQTYAYEHWGFDRVQIVQLFTIMDAMLVLPESMEEAFAAAVSQIQEEYQMTYINTIERVALRRERQEGKLEGRLEGKQEAAAALLAMQVTEKFGELPNWAETRLAQADEPTVKLWARQILTAQRIEDVFA